MALGSRRGLAGLVLLRELLDLQACSAHALLVSCRAMGARGVRTRRQALLQLLGLVGVLEDKGVQVSLAADLELDLLAVGVLLDPGG
jgi:hypothetical protein